MATSAFQQDATERLEVVLVDRGVTARAAGKLGRQHGVEVRRVGLGGQATGLSSYPARVAR